MTDANKERVALTTDSIRADGSRDRVEIRLSALPDERREVVSSALQRARNNMVANMF